MSQTGAVSRPRTTAETAQTQIPIESSTSGRGQLVCGSIGVCSRKPALHCSYARAIHAAMIQFDALNRGTVAELLNLAGRRGTAIRSRLEWRRGAFWPQGDNKFLTADEDLMARAVPGGGGRDTGSNAAVFKTHRATVHRSGSCSGSCSGPVGTRRPRRHGDLRFRHSARGPRAGTEPDCQAKPY